ncbi:MAG: hypothetical protein HRU80_04030 [Ignavibacteriales bacterium]|nr:MAG: hypothetical protein HRU80_04030 [Ignavibacteriales bacterium]
MRFLTAQPVFYIPDTAQVVSSSAGFTDLYRESSVVSSFSASLQDFSLSYSSPFSSRFAGRITVARYGFLTSYSREGDVSFFKASTASQKITGEISFSAGGFLIQPSFTVHELKNRYSYSYSLNAALRPERDNPPPLWMQLFTRNEPALIEAVAVDQNISVPYIFAESGSAAGGTIQLAGGFSLEGIYRKVYPEKTAEDDDFNGILAISSEEFEGALVRRSKNLKAGVRYHEFRGEGKIDAYYTNLSFSSISISTLRYKSWSAFSSFRAGRNYLLNAELSHYSARGRASGNIQTWPFSGFLISVFGNRVNAILQGGAELLTIRMSSEITTDDLRFVPKLSYYDIRPSLTTETWQPAFLIFGVKDYRKNVLRISRAGALLLSSDFYWNTGSWKLSAGFGQFIPVYITKRPQEETGVPSGGAGVSVKSDGGRWFSFTAGYYF